MAWISGAKCLALDEAAASAATSSNSPSAGSVVSSTPTAGMRVLRFAPHWLFIGEHPFYTGVNFSKQCLRKFLGDFMRCQVAISLLEDTVAAMRADSKQMTVAEVIVSRCRIKELVNLGEVIHFNPWCLEDSVDHNPSQKLGMVLLHCRLDLGVDVCQFVCAAIAHVTLLLAEWLVVASISAASVGSERAGRCWLLLEASEWWNLVTPGGREICSMDWSLVADITHDVFQK
jgi:hypothetical protein